MLVNIVVLEPVERRQWVVQARRCHAPGTNRCSHQMHGLRRVGQPVAKNKTVQRTEYQAFGAARRTGHNTDIVWLQAMILKVLACFGTCVNA